MNKHAGVPDLRKVRQIRGSETSGNIRRMTKRHGASVAQLHRKGISTGFLSSLGQGFMRQLYKAIPSCPSGFGFVWQEPSEKVLGFVACAESTGRVYKQSLRRRGLLMLLPLMRFMIRPSFVRQMIQTLRYPSQVGNELPAAEVLSIVVSEYNRRKGIGRALMDRAFEEFRKREIKCVKVAVWAGNEIANNFYLRCGFELAVTRQHHGLPMNVYVISL